MENISEQEVLEIAIEVAFNLLKNGAEIARVEDTIAYICKSYGASKIDCYAIPNLIIASIEDETGTYTTKIKRNYSVNNNLYKIEAFNQLSRDICKTLPTKDEVMTKIKEIKAKRVYHLAIKFLGAFIAAFGCSLFFGGTWRDSICGGLVGISVYALLQIELLEKHKVLYTLLASIFGGVISGLLCLIGIGENISFVMIGGVMMLIPGISIGTSLKDIIYGDVVSGSVRLIQAISASMAIAAGFSIWVLVFKQDIGFNRINPFYLMLLGGPAASIGYGIIFNLKPNKLLFISLGSLMSCSVYMLLLHVSPNDVFLATFAAVATGAIYAEVLARFIKAPAVCLMLPSIIVLVPGSTLFFMMCNLIKYDQQEFLFHLSTMVVASLAIALGIIVSQIVGLSISRIIREIKLRKIKKERA